MHWLAHFFGFAPGDGNGAPYLFWSGIGSDLAYLTVFAAAVGAYRRLNCQMHRCWRIGRHEFTDPDSGVARNLCWKHHPDVKSRQVTRDRLAEIQKRRHLYFGKQPGKG